MTAALKSLREARAFLQKADHDKGGWRVAAIASVDSAIKETQRGIRFDEKNASEEGALPLGAQPNMTNALAKLEEARTSLEKAEHDKGGWRVAAIASTEVAIRETRRGMAFDNEH